MPQVISFINMKGGVGKTTLAVNVAYGLAYAHHKNVLLIDCDPQFNATQYLLEEADYLAHTKDPKKGTLKEIFVPKSPGPVSTVRGTAKRINKTGMALAACTCPVYSPGKSRGKLDLIPSKLELMEITESKRGTEAKLKRFIDDKAADYDYVLIDCPPTISIFMQAALLASHKYIVPIKPDPLSVLGLPLLEKFLDEYCNDAGISIDAVGLVFTLVRGNVPRMQGVMDDLRNERGDQVFNRFLSQSTQVAESVEAHQPIFLYRPGGKTAKQALAVAQEFLDRTSGDGN